MHRYQVAFVDDEKEITEGFRELFGTSFEVKTFDDGASYLNYISNFEFNPFDVTVTDFNMKEINGVEMIRRATEMNRSCPFIVMSGQYGNDPVALYESRRFAFYVFEKPAEISKLKRLINQLCLQSKKADFLNAKLG